MFGFKRRAIREHRYPLAQSLQKYLSCALFTVGAWHYLLSIKIRDQPSFYHYTYFRSLIEKKLGRPSFFAVYSFLPFLFTQSRCHDVIQFQKDNAQSWWSLTMRWLGVHILYLWYNNTVKNHFTDLSFLAFSLQVSDARDTWSSRVIANPISVPRCNQPPLMSLWSVILGPKNRQSTCRYSWRCRGIQLDLTAHGNSKLSGLLQIFIYTCRSFSPSVPSK